jgi:hypothetical protein
MQSESRDRKRRIQERLKRDFMFEMKCDGHSAEDLSERWNNWRNVGI